MPEEPQPQTSTESGQPPRGGRRTRVSAGEPDDGVCEGVIRDLVPNAGFIVELANEQIVRLTASGSNRLRSNLIKLQAGDRVRLVHTNGLWRIIGKVPATRRRGR
jgi:translation initiation factor IF-1